MRLQSEATSGGELVGRPPIPFADENAATRNTHQDKFDMCLVFMQPLSCTATSSQP